MAGADLGFLEKGGLIQGTKLLGGDELGDLGAPRKIFKNNAI